MIFDIGNVDCFFRNPPVQQNLNFEFVSDLAYVFNKPRILGGGQVCAGPPGQEDAIVFCCPAEPVHTVRPYHTRITKYLNMHTMCLYTLDKIYGNLVSKNKIFSFAVYGVSTQADHQ